MKCSFCEEECVETFSHTDGETLTEFPLCFECKMETQTESFGDFDIEYDVDTHEVVCF